MAHCGEPARLEGWSMVDQGSLQENVKEECVGVVWAEIFLSTSIASLPTSMFKLTVKAGGGGHSAVGAWRKHC